MLVLKARNDLHTHLILTRKYKSRQLGLSCIILKEDKFCYKMLYYTLPLKLSRSLEIALKSSLKSSYEFT